MTSIASSARLSHSTRDRLYLALSCFVGVISGLSCADTTSPQLVVAVVAVASSVTALEAGDTVRLSATASTASGTPVPAVTFTWASTATSVATVDGNGLVRGLSAGSVTITATSNGISGSATLAATLTLDAISVSPATSTLEAGDTTRLTASPVNKNAIPVPNVSVTWSSSATGVATVNNGLVTGVGAGSATITATSGAKSGNASVVGTLTANAVSVTPDSLTIEGGDTTTVAASATNRNGIAVPTAGLTWSSAATGVVTISPAGLVTGAGAGTTTITATLHSKAGTSAVTGTLTVGSVVLSRDADTVRIAESRQLSLTVTSVRGLAVPSATVTWTTLSSTVATVNSSGAVSGVGAGNTSIVAASGSKADTTALRVNSRNPTIASLRANRYATEVGRPLTLIWQVTDPDAGEALTCTINIDNAGAAEVTYTNCADSTQAPITYASSGTHRVLFTASDGLGGVATDTLSIQVGAAATLSTGMNASVVLSAFGFNNARDGQTYNHNGGMASDGTRFFLADRNNNRVLAWNTLPTSDVAPDYVLGQTNFTANDPGTTLDKLNWPTALSIAGGKLLVADAYNNRILVWNTIPTTSGAAADFALTGSGSLVKWPWGVWTDGTRIAATSTAEGKILVWNTFPTGNTAASVVITNLGSGSGNPTPRSITSNGTLFSVADHNPPGQSLGGNHFWTSFPTANVAPDFFAPAPADPQYAWMQGDFSGSKLLLFGRYVWIYNSVPATASAVAAPSLTVKSNNTALEGGDGSDLKIFGGKVYVSMSNGNRVVGYNSVPTADREPDFVIGSPSLSTNTLLTNFLITNPNPASDGRRLFVTSDFDRKLYIWRTHPTASGTLPDATFSFRNAYDFQPRDNTLFGDVFMAAGETKVAIWRTLPTNGENPTTLLSGTIGNVTLTGIRGIAYDGRYTYITDGAKLYIWAGIPTASSNPAFNITTGTNDGSGRITSDGTNVAWVGADHKVYVCQVASLSGCATPQSFGGVGTLNLPEDVQLAAGRVFVADTGFNRVKVWNSLATALANSAPDAILGQANSTDVTPRIGQDKLFWPGNVMYDGRKVWVGEFKFSGRLVGYPIR